MASGMTVPSWALQQGSYVTSSTDSETVWESRFVSMTNRTACSFVIAGLVGACSGPPQSGRKPSKTVDQQHSEQLCTRQSQPVPKRLLNGVSLNSEDLSFARFEYEACGFRFLGVPKTKVSVCVDARGIANGPVTANHKSGNPYVRGQCSNGLAEGRWLMWLDGEIVLQADYSGGSRHGLWQRRRPDGSLLEQGRFSKDQKIGNWRYWDIRGEPPRVETHSIRPVEYRTDKRQIIEPRLPR